MLLRASLLLCCASSAWSFQPAIQPRAFSRGSVAVRNWPPDEAGDLSKGASVGEMIIIDPADTSIKEEMIVGGTVEQKVEETPAEEAPAEDAGFDAIIKSIFPDALTNPQLQTRVVKALSEKGFESDNTLLATSLCCDELARRLENDLCDVYGKNFNLGGLSGFPFAGNTGFGAMSAHIPDDGYCLIVHGPHVGVSKDGTIGKVERKGIELVDNCCGSAIAASNYLQGITDGGAKITTTIQEFTDFQQGAVQELILPHGKRLSEAEDRMLELPYALFDSQDMLIRDIIAGGAGGTKAGTAVLGGIQINTGPDTPDYFHPLRFDYMNNKGEILEDMLPLIMEG